MENLQESPNPGEYQIGQESQGLISEDFSLGCEENVAGSLKDTAAAVQRRIKRSNSWSGSRLCDS